MRRSQPVFFILIITALLMSNLINNLNAQEYNKLKKNEILKQQFTATKILSIDELITQKLDTKNSDSLDRKLDEKKQLELISVIVGFVASLLGIIGWNSKDLKSKIKHWSECNKLRNNLLENAIGSKNNIKIIKQKINNNIKLCCQLKRSSHLSNKELDEIAEVLTKFELSKNYIKSAQEPEDLAKLISKIIEKKLDIDESHKLLQASLYTSETDLQVINQDIKFCLDVQDQLLHSNEISLLDLVKARIEYEILKEEKPNQDNLRQIFDSDEKIKKILIKNCFSIHNQLDKIKKYLEAMNGESRFFCYVEIEEGFIAPLYLIAGPLHYFEEDWPKFIQEYKDSIVEEDKINYFNNPHLRTFKSSIFTTWIGWGPSIPVCSCNRWEGQVTFQYGFGDENNSIPILIPDDEQVRTQYTDKFFNDENHIVKNARVTAKLELISKSTSSSRIEKIAKAQAELRDPARPEIVLTDVKSSIPSASTNYYSAYLWVLFGITNRENLEAFKKTILDSSNPKINQKNSNDSKIKTIWRDMLPFFEHVNIADQYSYSKQKKIFACQVLESLKVIYLDLPIEKRDEIKFVYFCALDDCNCSSGILASKALRQESIKDILQNFTRQKQSSEIETKIQNLIIWDRDILPACELPYIINKLNKHMDEHS